MIKVDATYYTATLEDKGTEYEVTLTTPDNVNLVFSFPADAFDTVVYLLAKAQQQGTGAY